MTTTIVPNLQGESPVDTKGGIGETELPLRCDQTQDVIYTRPLPFFNETGSVVSNAVTEILFKILCNKHYYQYIPRCELSSVFVSQTCKVSSNCQQSIISYYIVVLRVSLMMSY